VSTGNTMPTDENLQRYREVFERIPVGIYRTTPDGRFLHANPAFVSLLGYDSYEEIAAVNAKDLYDDPADRAVWCEIMDRDGVITDQDTRKVRRDGTTVWLRDNARCVRDQEGKILYYEGAVVDVTEAHRVAEQLARSERMASVGMLAAGVAHEINNPLAYVMTNVEFAVEQLRKLLRSQPEVRHAEALGEVARALSEAVDGTERVRGIVTQLSEFARDQKDTVAFSDIGDVVASAVRMVQHELRHSATLHVDVDALPPVVGSPTKLAQVFVNLLLNSAQAFSDQPPELSEVRIVGRRGDAETVVVSVSDTAGGIPPDMLKRVFDPFFTTKERGTGTGLGLAVSQSTVVAAGGTLDVQSELGKGTTFAVTLPVSHVVDDPAPSQRRFSSIPAGEKVCVLIVDDEPLIGRSLRRALRPDYDVTLATGGKQAMEKIVAGEWFDAILCDVMMPEMSGTEFHGWLLEAHPMQARRLAFITGGAFGGKATAYMRACDVPALSKPISNLEVRALLREITIS
jgi:PAS domain S-box-containing protein